MQMHNPFLQQYYSSTTSKTQPLDVGIINSMKCNYKKRLIHKLLLSYETKIEFKLTLLGSLNYIKLSWDDVKQETVSNCFNHCWKIKLVNPECEVI